VRNRSNLLVLLGIAFFVVGGIIVYVLTNDGGGSGSSASGGPVPVVLATQDIPAGALAKDMIDQGHLTLSKVPAAQLVPGAIQSLNQLSGGTFVQGFAKDQQITGSGLQAINRAFKVPEGYEAIAVQIDFVAGGAGYVNPGDHVNLYGAFPTLNGSPAPRAELLLTNIQVLDVNLAIPARRGTADASATRATGDNVTYLLAVRTADAEKIVFTTEFESLYATLTAENAPPAGPTPGRDGSNILEVEPNVAAG
jgi:pilus assembly protein CpaB